MERDCDWEQTSPAPQVSKGLFVQRQDESKSFLWARVNVTLSWKQGLCRSNQVQMSLYWVTVDQMSLYWVTVDPDPVTGVLSNRGKFGHRLAGRRPCEDGGSHWREAATSQETPGAPGGAGRDGGTSPGAWEGAPPCQHLDVCL